jgi:hypothetical protein
MTKEKDDEVLEGEDEGDNGKKGAKKVKAMDENSG